MKTTRFIDCDGEGKIETERACPDPIRGGELVGAIEECPTCDGEGEAEEDTVDFLRIAQDDLRDCRGLDSTAEYVASLLEQLYMLCPYTRNDINLQWDDMKNG